MDYFNIVLFDAFQISSTCPVCVTYEARSKFVITSLRPAFAKIYPSSRPDLAVETFFHARPGSPLLKGITDDDFITWFDKTQLASLKTNTNIDNICECGRICSRDYEFRTEYEKKHPKTTETSSTENFTTDESTTISLDTTKTNEISSTDTNDVSTTTVRSIDTSMSPSTDLNDNTTIYSSTEITTKSDDPIIIPTITYINHTDNQSTSNEIEHVPKINGELIVQKVPVNKSYLKKSLLLKKPLPRRKGTLKATYGDKHEKFFIKDKPINVVKITNLTEKNTTVAIKPEPSIQIVVKENISSTAMPPVTTPKVNKLDKNITTTENNILFTTKATELNKNVTSSLKNIIQTTKSTETTSMPHTITTITKSNIKNIHYRTKKPKPKTQIKKPVIYINDTHKDLNNNTTKDDTIIKSNKVSKHLSKSIKSINKEIHKMPSNPISETDLDKSINSPVKIDIAPENKGGYEILDKNNIWELLKDPNNAKIDIEDDKSQNNRSL